MPRRALRPLLMVAFVLLPALAGCGEKGEGGDGGDGGANGPPITGAPAWTAPEIRADGCFTAATVPLAYPEPVVVLETSMGTIEAQVFTQLVPETAKQFLDLVAAGHYDGLPFHRIMTDFMMQGGDGARAEGGARSADTIEDEFHHRLRHDQKGLLSMANAGPNTGSDQFFITFKETAWLNDWHTVFGKVVSGMDVVDRVNAEASSRGGNPTQPVTLERATVRPAAEATGLPADFGVLVPDAQQKVGVQGGKAAFTVLVESCTDHVLTVDVEADAEAGSAAPADGFARFDLPAAQRRVLAVHADVPAGPAGAVPVEIAVRAGGVERKVTVEVVRAADVGTATVDSGESVQAHYIGFLTDGRVFDTSLPQVAAEARLPKFEASFDADRPRSNPFTFTPGAGVIAGFTKLAVGTQEGGTNAGRFSPVDGYGERFQAGQDIFTGHPLTGKPLFFQLEVVDIT